MTRATWLGLIAKHPGKCSKCRRRINVGDAIEWHPTKHRIKCALGMGCRR